MSLCAVEGHVCWFGGTQVWVDKLAIGYVF